MHGLRLNFDRDGAIVGNSELSSENVSYASRRWLVHRDNSWSERTNLEAVDLAVFAGTPEWLGDMVNPLVEKVVKSTIPTMYLGLGAFERTKKKTFEKLTMMDQLSLIRSLLITVRDETCAGILEPLKPIHLPCPALFASPDNRLRTDKVRIAVSTQGISGRNGQNVEPAVLNYSVKLFRALATAQADGSLLSLLKKMARAPLRSP